MLSLQLNYGHVFIDILILMNEISAKTPWLLLEYILLFFEPFYKTQIKIL